MTRGSLLAACLLLCGCATSSLVLLPDDVVPLTPAEAAELPAATLREGPDAQLGRALELASAAASR